VVTVFILVRRLVTVFILGCRRARLAAERLVGCRVSVGLWTRLWILWVKRR
jgi:hypothetical protein